jgi:hypothetical protein
MHHRGESASDEDGRYHLALCGLNGDDTREGHCALLRGALDPQDYPMLRVSLSARCNARRTLGERQSGTERLLEAVSAYRDALTALSSAVG